MSQGKLRDDILVSVCFTDASDPELTPKRMAPLVAALSEKFRYWEILLVNETGSEAAFEATLCAVPNLRYLSVVPGLDNTQRRVIGASEAIGDIVVITSIHEMDTMDIPRMVETAHAENAVIMGQRDAAAFVEPLIVVLGRASGFNASTRDMQTITLPRTILNRLLSDPNPLLALRFTPRDNTVKVLRQKPNRPLAAPRTVDTDRARARARFDLLARMVTDAGPAFLGTVAALSALVVLGAVLFALYVVVVYLTRETIAEGWTTLSLSIASLLGFLGAALFAICITLRKVAEIIRGSSIDYLVAESSSVDLFDSVANALNVDTDASGTLQPAPTEKEKAT